MLMNTHMHLTHHTAYSMHLQSAGKFVTAILSYLYVCTFIVISYHLYVTYLHYCPYFIPVSLAT